jgi:multidrug efflux pump
VGGLLVSQVLSLFTPPVIFLAFDSLGLRLREWRERRAARRGASRPGVDQSGGQP